MSKYAQAFCRNVDIEQNIYDSLDKIIIENILKLPLKRSEFLINISNKLLPCSLYSFKWVKTQYGKKHIENLLSTIEKIKNEFITEYNKYDNILKDEIHYSEDEINMAIIRISQINTKISILDELKFYYFGGIGALFKNT